MKVRGLRFLLLGLSLSLLLATAGCGSGGGSKGGPIYLGMANPMSGDNAWIGETKVRAVELAVKMVNEKGGIDGREVKVVIEDDQGNPSQAANVAKKLAADSRILSVIGHWNSSCALAAISTYTQYKVPLITDAASQQLSNSSPYMFRICLTDDQVGRQLARYVFEKKGHRKIATLYPNNDFGVGINKAFCEEFKALGGTVLTEEAYFEGTSKDFTPQLTKIKQLNPEAIFLGGYYTEAALICQQARDKLAMSVPFYGSDGINSEDLIKLGGKSVEGVTFVGYFHPLREFPGTREFVAAFQKEYGREPDTFGALAFDSANMILEAIRKNGASREGIRQYLHEVKGFPGVAGPTSFFDSGDCDRQITLLTIKDGKIMPAEVQF